MLEKLKSFKSKFRYDDSEMPFMEHLEEFRKTVIRIVIHIIAVFTRIPDAVAAFDHASVELGLAAMTTTFRGQPYIYLQRALRVFNHGNFGQ